MLSRKHSEVKRTAFNRCSVPWIFELKPLRAIRKLRIGVNKILAGILNDPLDVEDSVFGKRFVSPNEVVESFRRNAQSGWTVEQQ